MPKPKISLKDTPSKGGETGRRSLASADLCRLCDACSTSRFRSTKFPASERVQHPCSAERWLFNPGAQYPPSPIRQKRRVVGMGGYASKCFYGTYPIRCVH